MTADNNKQLWIPPGFAHGFATLTDKAQVLYKTTEYWYKEHDRSIRYDDPFLNIKWPSIKSIILSDKDKTAPLLSEAELFD